MAEIELSRLIDVKEEVEEFPFQTGTDAQCVKEEETGQEAPSHMTDWFAVTLLEVKARKTDYDNPTNRQTDATISITNEQVPDSTASKFIARHPELVGQTVVVNTDLLQPMSEAVLESKSKRKDAECDPSQQLVGVAIGPWDPIEMYKDFIMYAVHHSLQWLQSSTISSIDGVDAFLDDKVSSSTVLQVRANREFKKGELWLCPYGGTLVRETDKDDQFRDVDELCQSGKTLHKELTRFLSITTSTGQPVNKRKSQNEEKKMEPITGNFRLVSPLFQNVGPSKAKNAYNDNLAPFWALTPGADGDTNMRIEEYVVKDKGPEAVKLGYVNGKKNWKSSRELTIGNQFETTITVPVATNNVHIAIGDILCIPKGVLATKGSLSGSQPSDSATLGS